jgi:hypothetical protein
MKFTALSGCVKKLWFQSLKTGDSPSSRTKLETSLCLIIKLQWKDSEICRRLACMRFLSAEWTDEEHEQLTVPSQPEDKGYSDSDRWLSLLHKRSTKWRSFKVSHLMDGCLKFSMVLELSWYHTNACRRRQNRWRSPLFSLNLLVPLYYVLIVIQSPWQFSAKNMNIIEMNTVTNVLFY